MSKFPEWGGGETPEGGEDKKGERRDLEVTRSSLSPGGGGGGVHMESLLGSRKTIRGRTKMCKKKKSRGGNALIL